MKTLWESQDRSEISERVDTLTPESRALWGKMNATQMMAHLVDQLRMSTGELPVQEKKLPIRFTPLKQIIIYGPPFPKNLPTAPELKARQPQEWDAECADLRRMMDVFAAQKPTKKLPRHPAFGALSRRAWGVLSYRHIDHHLKQFGV